MTDLQLHIEDLDLRRDTIRRRVETLLAAAGLDLEPAPAYMAGLCDEDGALCGCGGLDGNIIKCLALDESLRGGGMAAALITHLLDRAFDTGHSNVRVFTKPEYAPLFGTMGFATVGRSEEAVLLESDHAQLRLYLDYLSRHKADGVIVANANPPTLGHIYLVRKAAAQCDRLALIPVAENDTDEFTYRERLDSLRDALADIANVDVLEGSPYAVSPFTFPSYFIKDKNRASEIQASLDLDVFCRHIAPSLGARMRFVGTEPSDPLTAQYNRVMKRMLPGRGISVTEIERIEQEGMPVSASRVRSLLSGGKTAETLKLVPRADIPAILAYLAAHALQSELDLEPKPGLVDPHDNGSHSDMDHALMSRSIRALRPWFFDTARRAFRDPSFTGTEMLACGIEGERQMLSATGGVNTHRGAVFAMGIAVISAARILAGFSTATLRGEMAANARRISEARPEPEPESHGREMCRRHGIPGAMDMAAEGWPRLFDDWVPFLQENPDTPETHLRLLMKIISDMPDTNAYYRAGADAAESAMREAAEIYGNFSIDRLHGFNRRLKEQNISHGGCADMLGLAFFIRNILPSLRNPEDPKDLRDLKDLSDPKLNLNLTP